MTLSCLGTKLEHRLDAVMATFDQLVSPEQKELSELVTTSGGVEAIKDNDKMLLVLEETATRASSTPGAEGPRALRTNVGETDDLKADIFEDPTAGVKKNEGLFFRKFEAQKIQINDELSLAVQRDSDRDIQEVTDGPHEQIRDRVSRFTPCPSTTCMPHYSPFLQSIYEIWKAMVNTVFFSICERGVRIDCLCRAGAGMSRLGISYSLFETTIWRN